MPARADYLNYYLKQQRFARFVNSLSLLMAIALHVFWAFFLLRSIKIEPIKQPVFVEVKMLSVAAPVSKVIDKVPTLIIKEPVTRPPVIKKLSQVPIKKPAMLVPLAPNPSSLVTTEIVPVEHSERPSTLATQDEKTPITNAEPVAKNPSSSIQAHDDDKKTVISGIMPLVKVNPIYPNRAASRGIEGWVRIEFTILADGLVKDAIVVQAMPEAVFDEAALAAIEQWQFKPKMVNGVAVSQRAAQQLQFKLDR